MFQTSWKELNPAVTYADVLQCEPEFIWGPRIIHEHQFIYVVKGRGTAKIQTRDYEAREGDLFYYGPGVVHTFKADARDPFLVYGMHFVLNGPLPDPGEVPPAIRRVSGDYVSGNENRLLIDGGGTGCYEIPEYCHPDSSAVQELFLQVTQHYSRTEATSPLMIRSLLIQFLLALKSATDPEKPHLSNQNQSIMYVKSQLDLRAELPYSRTWLKEWTKYNEDYIARNFREHLGVSPYQYHQDIKMHKAKELLARTNLSVTEIAEKLHLGTVHYFSRWFKLKTGHSPMGYRHLRKMI